MVKHYGSLQKFNQPQILGSNYMQQNYYKKLAHFYGNHQLSQNLMIHGPSHVGSMQREYVEQWYHDMRFVLDIWRHFVGIINFHKIGWYMALHVGSMQSAFVEQMISWHVVCVGHLRNFVRGKYGQPILCHIFEAHTRNYFATRETHEFNISHKTGNRNPTVMGLGKLAPPVHHALEVEVSRSKLPLSQSTSLHGNFTSFSTK